MPSVQMKWHNLNVGFKLSINSGAALVLWALCFFALLWMAQHHESIERLFPSAVIALDVGFGGYLLKRHGNNRLDNQLKIAKNGFTSAEK